MNGMTVWKNAGHHHQQDNVEGFIVLLVGCVVGGMCDEGYYLVNNLSWMPSSSFRAQAGG